MAKKRSDGRYAKQVVLGYRNGKPVRKTIYGKTLKELDKKYRDFMNDKESGRLIKNDKIKFKELLELWFTNTKVGELKPQSLGNLKSQIKGVNYYIGDKLAKDIQRSDIEQIRAELIEEDHIDKYNKALGIIRAVFNYAIECGFVLNNPTLGMKRISIKRNTAGSDLRRSVIVQIDGTDAGTRENRADGIVLVQLIVEIELAVEALAIFGDDNASAIIFRDNVGDQISIQHLTRIVDRKELTHTKNSFIDKISPRVLSSGAVLGKQDHHPCLKINSRS